MEIIKKTILKSTTFLNLVEIDYLNKNGKPSKWVSAERTANRKAVMIIATVGDRLVVNKEYRVPIGGFEWSMPAGLIDENEDIKTASIRELKEETGLNIDEFLKISPFVYNTAGLSNESISLVFVKASGEVNHSLQEESENIEVHLLSKEEVKTLMNQSDVMISAKAWLIFDRFCE